MIYLLIVGFVSTLGQVVLLRELSVAFFGVELIYSLALGIWMIWIAAGASIGRRHTKPSIASINILFVLVSLLIPAEIAFIRSVRPLFFAVPGAYLPFETQILAMSLSLLPICFLLGLMFQWAARVYIDSERSLAGAYAIESVGGIAGGMCATLLLMFQVENLQLALLCSFFSMAAVFTRREKRPVRPLTVMAAALSVLLVAGAWHSENLDRLMTRWTHPGLVVTKDSPYGRVTVTSLAGQVSVFENDALSFETEGTGAEEFVHLAALQHPRTARVLILGGGLDGTLREALKYGPSAVDYVELNPVLMKMVAPALPAEFRVSLSAPVVHVFIDDPRRFLEGAANYDLILAGMPEPSSGQANRFYTSEFFNQCARRLNSEGVLAFRLQSSENFWTPQVTTRMVSIYRAAKSAFSDVLVLPGSTNIIICSRGLLMRDPASLAGRYVESGIRARLVSPAYIQYVYGNDRFQEIARVLESGTAPPNTDDRPVCYQYTVMMWLSKFFPTIGSWDLRQSIDRNGGWVSPWWLLAPALAGLILLSRRRESVRRAIMMGLAGFIGMVLEISLILIYQVNKGILFQDLGILLMSFMAGLSLGAGLLGWIMSLNFVDTHRMASRIQGLILFIGFGLVSASIALRVEWHSATSLLETSILLLIAGLLVGGVFVQASSCEGGDQGRLIRPLYSADLIGGSLGSLTCSLLLVPIAGLGLTALLMVPLALVSLLLL